MRVIACNMGENAREMELGNTLTEMQDFVGGYIECCYPFDDNVCLVCNEEGKLMGLPINRALCFKNGAIYDLMCGNFFLCGLNDEDGDFDDFPDELVGDYLILMDEWKEKAKNYRLGFMF